MLMRRIAASLLPFLFCMCTPLAAWAASAKPAGKSPVVRVAQGQVRGVSENGISVFRNIPYAAPPTGTLRWLAPQPAQRWSGTLDGSRFGPACAQNRRLGDFAEASSAEDCLTINVFAPPGSARRPVMVWIHGGGLFVGGSDAYDSTALARQGVVVVTFNYRLNLFGFLRHPALAQTGESSNFGLADQRAALRWVHANITRFGGDAGNVTIFGESAGGFSVLAHLVSPLSRGLFDKAIIQSGGYGFAASSGQRTADKADAAGRTFAHASGCDATTTDAAKCLRALPVERVLAAEEAAGAAFEIGGPDLPEPIAQAIEAGRFARVPVIIGGNRDEYRWFEALRELKTGQAARGAPYHDRFRERFGPKTARVTAAYVSPGQKPDVTAFAAAVGDQFFICPAMSATQALSRWTPVWSYEFADRNAPSYLPPVSFPLGAAHTAELGYLFPGFGHRHKPAEAPAPETTTLAQEMIRRWTTFARTAEPTAAGGTNWPRFTQTSQNTLVLAAHSSLDGGMTDRHKCSLWNPSVND